MKKQNSMQFYERNQEQKLCNNCVMGPISLVRCLPFFCGAYNMGSHQTTDYHHVFDNELNRIYSIGTQEI